MTGPDVTAIHRAIGYGLVLSVPFWGALLVYLTR